MAGRPPVNPTVNEIMPDLKQCVRLFVSVLAALSVVLGIASCNFVRVAKPAAEGPATLNFRIENATASSTDLTITVDTGLAEATSQAKSLVRAQTAAGGQPLAEQATVRVGPSDFSEGVVLCGRQVTLAATVGGEAMPAELSGDGTGTPGFDEGSVGLAGERFLLLETHFACGDTVVIRIEDDGTGVGTSTSSVGLGVVTVYAEGQVPPVGDLPALEAVEEPIDEDIASPVETAVAAITIENQTFSTINVELRVGTGDTTSDDTSNVTVVPLGVADGSVECAQQITVQATIVDADSGAIDAEVMQFQINLSGAGTGTIGFDEDTIGPGNTRILLQDEHFTCGDTIRIVIFDDASDV
ncbi:MAG: hypothetical protein ACE5GE_17510, partial [Phycisphaerae bacterium]